MKESILDFLRQLADAQDKALGVLQRKQTLLVRPNKVELDACATEEQNALELLRKAIRRREEILLDAQNRGYEADTIEILCEKIFSNSSEYRPSLDAVMEQTRQIRYLALANWTITQRSIIHLSQILEIIETRGQGKTTYSPQNGKESTQNSGGGFVDRVA